MNKKPYSDPEAQTRRLEQTETITASGVDDGGFDLDEV